MILLFAALVSGVYLYATGDLKLFDRGQTKANEGGLLQTEEQFREKLAELRINRQKLLNRKKLMEERKAETVAFLKDKGISSESDLSDKEVRYAINNLKLAVADLKVVETSAKKYTDTIASVEAMLTNIEQRALADDVAISDDEKIEMSALILHVDDELLGDEPDIFEAFLPNNKEIPLCSSPIPINNRVSRPALPQDPFHKHTWTLFTFASPSSPWQFIC